MDLGLTDQVAGSRGLGEATVLGSIRKTVDSAPVWVSRQPDPLN